jgi:hypothetical protein
MYESVLRRVVHRDCGGTAGGSGCVQKAGPAQMAETGTGDTEPSERVEAGLEQAELIALGVGKNVPGLLAGLADLGRARPEPQ